MCRALAPLAATTAALFRRCSAVRGCAACCALCLATIRRLVVLGLLVAGLSAGPRPRPLGLVKPERTVVAEGLLHRAALSVATAKLAAQVLASFAPSQVALVRATGVVARAKPVVPAAQQVAWSALARCSHTRSQRRRLLHGALLAAAGEFGLMQPARLADVVSDWCATQEVAGTPLLVTGKDARVIPTLLLSVLGRLQRHRPRIDPQGLAVAELCAASVLEYISLPSPRKGVFNVPDLRKLSPSALVNCRLLTQDASEASPGFYFALKAKATAEVTALHETVQTAGIPVPAPAARRAKAAIFVEDVSLPLRAEVPLAAETLFGPGPQAREAFAWQLPQQILFAKLRTRLKSFRGDYGPERSKRTAPGALVVASLPRHTCVSADLQVSVVVAQWASYLSLQRRALQPSLRLVALPRMRASLAAALWTGPRDLHAEVEVHPIDRSSPVTAVDGLSSLPLLFRDGTLDLEAKRPPGFDLAMLCEADFGLQEVDAVQSR
ncbi:unnamed protein product, partial [Symbiodinium necroappetens]